jgi:hypothetical protein
LKRKGAKDVELVAQATKSIEESLELFREKNKKLKEVSTE